MTCDHCGAVVHGQLRVVDLSPHDPNRMMVLAIVSTPDRDWIICDSCNVMR